MVIEFGVLYGVKCLIKRNNLFGYHHFCKYLKKNWANMNQMKIAVNLVIKVHKLSHFYYNINFEMRVNFNKFSMNSSRWKCVAISNDNFHLIHICSIFSSNIKIYNKGDVY